MRRDLLEFAVLGLLQERPIHGYEIRKELAQTLGPFRSLSYGTLYPTLRRLVNGGAIEPLSLSPARQSTAPALSGRRARIVYGLTEEGRTEFQAWANRPNARSWDDEAFAAHMAFFSRTERRARLRILHGRRSWLEEHLELWRSGLQEREMDPYSRRMQEHGIATTEREVEWLSQLIEEEMKEEGVERK